MGVETRFLIVFSLAINSLFPPMPTHFYIITKSEWQSKNWLNYYNNVIKIKLCI